MLGWLGDRGESGHLGEDGKKQGSWEKWASPTCPGEEGHHTRPFPSPAWPCPTFLCRLIRCVDLYYQPPQWQQNHNEELWQWVGGGRGRNEQEEHHTTKANTSLHLSWPDSTALFSLLGHNICDLTQEDKWRSSYEAFKFVSYKIQPWRLMETHLPVGSLVMWEPERCRTYLLGWDKVAAGPAIGLLSGGRYLRSGKGSACTIVERQARQAPLLHTSRFELRIPNQAVLKPLRTRPPEGRVIGDLLQLSEEHRLPK